MKHVPLQYVQEITTHLWGDEKGSRPENLRILMQRLWDPVVVLSLFTVVFFLVYLYLQKTLFLLFGVTSSLITLGWIEITTHVKERKLARHAGHDHWRGSKENLRVLLEAERITQVLKIWGLYNRDGVGSVVGWIELEQTSSWGIRDFFRVYVVGSMVGGLTSLYLLSVDPNNMRDLERYLWLGLTLLIICASYEISFHCFTLSPRETRRRRLRALRLIHLSLSSNLETVSR